MPGRNALYQTLCDDFVSEFAGTPLGDGTPDLPRRTARQGHDLTERLSRDARGGTGAGCIGKSLAQAQLRERLIRDG